MKGTGWCHRLCIQDADSWWTDIVEHGKSSDLLVERPCYQCKLQLAALNSHSLFNSMNAKSCLRVTFLFTIIEKIKAEGKTMRIIKYRDLYWISMFILDGILACKFSNRLCWSKWDFQSKWADYRLSKTWIMRSIYIPSNGARIGMAMSHR